MSSIKTFKDNDGKTTLITCGNRFIHYPNGNEPDEKDQLDIPLAMQLTGGDTIYARDLVETKTDTRILAVEEPQDTDTILIGADKPFSPPSIVTDYFVPIVPPQTRDTIIDCYPQLCMELRKSPTGRIRLLKFHGEECIPSVSSLGPKSLNNKYSKLVHSALVSRLKPYFVDDKKPYGLTNGYDNLPEDLLKEFQEHLHSARKVA